MSAPTLHAQLEALSALPKISVTKPLAFSDPICPPAPPSTPTPGSPTRTSVPIMKALPALPSFAQVSTASAPGSFRTSLDSPSTSSTYSSFYLTSMSASLIAIRDGVAGGQTSLSFETLETLYPFVDDDTQVAQEQVKDPDAVCGLFGSLMEMVNRILPFDTRKKAGDGQNATRTSS